MIKLIQVTSDEELTQVRQLFLEYIQSLNSIAQEYGISLDEVDVLDTFMQGVNDFTSPQDRLYISYCDGELAGIGCLQELSEDIGEIKRMFVRSDYRRRGIGSTILDQLINDARSIG